MIILSGDIGGTKSHLALYQDNVCIADKKYPSQQYQNLSEVLLEFLSSYPAQVDGACLGVAGPVVEGVCKMTNLPWIVDTKILASTLRIPQAWLMNDIAAYAYGLSCLSSQDFYILNPGRQAQGNAALIAVGTGLGEAGLYWDGNTYHCFVSEGGQVDFAPRDDLEIDLFKYLKKKFLYVSYERVLSGAGLIELFRFLIDVKNEKTPDWLDQILLQDLPKVITEKALKKECALCEKVVEWFISIMGSESGNLALKFLALGGVYIGGGVPLKMTSIFKEGGFMKSFKSKGRFEELLSSIPVSIILNEKTALLGAAAFAGRQI